MCKFLLPRKKFRCRWQRHMFQKSVALIENMPILEELRQVPWTHLCKDTI